MIQSLNQDETDSLFTLFNFNEFPKNLEKIIIPIKKYSYYELEEKINHNINQHKSLQLCLLEIEELEIYL